MNNKRRAKHWITLHFLFDTNVNEIKCYWKKIKSYLKRASIVAYRSIEITRDENKKPTNRVHFHFLVDSPLSENELKSTFRDCCLCSELNNSSFRIDYRKIFNFLGIACYVTKLNRPEKAILFEKHTGIRKFETIGNWYVDEAGDPISRKQAWQNIIDEQTRLSIPQKNIANDSNTSTNR